MADQIPPQQIGNNVSSVVNPPIQSSPTAQPTQIVDPLLTDKTMPEDLDTMWNSWKCQVCEYVYEGQKAITQCPRCGNADPDKFD